MRILFKLYVTFFKIGLFTFGGGYAMLPMLEREVCDNNKWIEKDEIYDYYAIGQATPGIIAVNTATFCGMRVRGFFGALFASLGIISPSIIIILLIASLLKTYSHIEVISHAFAGIRVCVCAMVLSTVIDMIKRTCKDYVGVLILIATFLAVAFFKVSPAIVVIAVGVLGIFLKRG